MDNDALVQRVADAIQQAERGLMPNDQGWYDYPHDERMRIVARAAIAAMGNQELIQGEIGKEIVGK